MRVVSIRAPNRLLTAVTSRSMRASERAADLRHVRVLIELDSDDLRKGATRNALDLAQSAREFGFECVLCGPLDEKFRSVVSGLGVATIRGGSRMFARSELPLYVWSVARWLARFRRVRPDVVHLNYTGWGPSLACAAYWSGIPVVARAGGGYDPRNPSQKWIAAYVGNSEAHAAALLNSPLRDRVVVTGPLVRSAAPGDGPAGDPPPPKRAGRCRLLFLGQLVERKGLHVLADAAPFFSPDVDLMLVGGDWQDEFARDIRERLEHQQVETRTWLSNHRTDVENLFRNSDVLVVPSLQDTLPRVVIEAMLNALPVVASAVGGIPNLIQDGITGFVVPPGDPKALADAVNRLAGSEELRRQFGGAGRRRAEAEFGPKTTLERYAALYRRLAHGG